MKQHDSSVDSILRSGTSHQHFPDSFQIERQALNLRSHSVREKEAELESRIMKARLWIQIMVIVLAVGGIVIARKAWRARCQLITLDIPNETLDIVLRKVEAQVWKKIRTEESLAGVHVTLHAKDTPLPEVLDLLAAQAGAYWNTLYVVYPNASSLNNLNSTLQGNGNIEAAGWIKIAPRPSERKEGIQPDIGPVRSPEMGSPLEVVVDSSFKNRLTLLQTSNTNEATASFADRTAREVGGKWTTFFAIRKSNMGIGFRMPRKTPLQKVNGPTSSGSSQADSLARPDHEPRPDPMLQPPNPNRKFENLTPEQRVKLAREKHGHGG